MPIVANGSCPVCRRQLALPPDASGRRARCPGCHSMLRALDEVGRRYELMVEPGVAFEADEAFEVWDAADGGDPAPVHGEASPTGGGIEANGCARCGAGCEAGDSFCAHCGADLASERRNAVRRREIARGAELERTARQRKARRAARSLVVLSVVFTLGGAVRGREASAEADRARAELVELPRGMQLTVEGRTFTVAELLQRVDLEVALVYAVNFGLAAVMLGLFFWARRAPFPAILTGLCTFLVVLVVNAVVDPTTLGQGVVVKVFAVLALVGGLKAALSERAAAARSQGQPTSTAEVS